MLLGSHHVLVARTENLEDLGHAFRTVCHRTDSLYATNLVDLADTGNACCYEDGGIHLAFAIGRCAEHNLLAAGNLGGSSQHQDCREKWGSASGNIESYTLDGDTLLPTGDTFLGFYLLAYEALGDVEHLDIVVSQNDGIAQFIADQFLGFVHLCFTDGKVRKFCFIELQLIFSHGFVATLSDVSQYSANRLVQLREVKTWASGNLTPLFPFRILIYLHDNPSLNSQL